MRKWIPYAGTVLAVVGLALVFQMTFGSSSNEPSTLVDASNDFQGGTLAVSEVGEVSLEPDMATIHLGAQAVDTSADEAQSQVNVRINAVRQVLEEYGIDKDDIQTARMSVNPDYQLDPMMADGNGEERFRAEHILEIDFKQIDELGELIDDVSEAGANRIEQTRFALQNSEEAEHEALEQAIEKTISKADVMAQSAGRERGEVLQITDQQAQVNLPMQHYDQSDGMMERAESSTVIESGQVTITQRVDVVYELK
ncbi:SIMPL domain-containing protein [Salipaludibacillus sp. HK11]|uniref:SIMPL domain-containing protein n=1 Tax=Salipaludibacillus sp. HK11 TaxID=3394320 RepID=UPI0039FCE37E